MRRKTFSLCSLSVALCALSGLASAINTSDPYEPLNWKVTSVTTGSGEQKTYTWVNGKVQESVTQSSTPRGWVSLVRIPVDYQATATCQGSTTFTVKWIGNPSATPTKALVRLSAYARRSHDGSVNSGLPKVYEEWVEQYMFEQLGQAYREVSISGGTGTVTVSGNATVVYNHSQNDSWVTTGGEASWNANCEVVRKALTVTSLKEPSYGIGPYDNPILLSNPNIDDREVWTCMTINADGSGVFADTVTATTLGQWSARAFLNYTWYEVNFSNPFATYLPVYKTFTAAQVESMIDSGAFELAGPETISDSGDGQSRTAKIKLRIYTPRAFPVINESKIVTGPWKPASNWVRVNTWETNPVKLTMTNGVVDTVTTSTTYGVNGELSGPFKKIYEWKIAGSYSYESSKSAEISKTLAVEREFSPNASITYEYRFIRAATWRERRGWGMRFAANGYQGLEDFVQIDFASGSKAAAEAGDYIEDVERRVVAP